MTNESLDNVIAGAEYRIRATEHIMKKLEEIADKNKLNRLYIDIQAVHEELEDFIQTRMERAGVSFSYATLIRELSEEEKKP
jgi:predicted transcriptional regulator